MHNFHVSIPLTALVGEQMVYMDPAVDSATVSAIRQAVPKEKVLLSVGGADSGSMFSKMARLKAKRAVFVKSVVKMLRTQQLDGVDIDW